MGHLKTYHNTTCTRMFGDPSQINSLLTCLEFNVRPLRDHVCILQQAADPNSKLFAYPTYNKYKCLYDRYVSLAEKPTKCLNMTAAPYLKEECLKKFDEKYVSWFVGNGDYMPTANRTKEVVKEAPFVFKSNATVK